jgi:Uma2 family endonuclease
MAEPAIRRMSLAEFLVWDDGTDTRYELIDGVPVAMAPPAGAHGMLCSRLGGAIDASLRTRRPCRVVTEAGIPRPDRADTCYIADLAVTCRAHQRGELLIEEPILVVEILSRGTERHDRHLKVPAYRRIASVQEILLLDSENYYAEVLRRDGERWLIELVQGREARLRLDLIGLEIAMAELYDRIDIGDDTAA